MASGGRVPMLAKDGESSFVSTRLLEAAASGEPVELMLVLRGTVRPVPGADLRMWRIRTHGRLLTFRSDAVVAARPVERRAPRGRRGARCDAD